MKHEIKEFTISLIFFAIFLFLIAVSSFGVNTPENTPVQTIGTMQLGTYKDGLSLYQGYRNQYYLFSPANDYYINSKNERVSLITQQEIENNAYKSSYRESHWNDIVETVKSYFRITAPAITFTNKNQIKYTTQNNGNKLSVKEHVIFSDNNNKPRLMGITLSIKPRDIVYDSKGTLYQYWDEQDPTIFSQLYGVKFNPNFEDLRPEITDGKIVIANPNIKGVIVVRTTKGQKLYFNRNANLIEIEQIIRPKAGVYTTSMNIEIYPSPKNL